MSVANQMVTSAKSFFFVVASCAIAGTSVHIFLCLLHPYSCAHCSRATQLPLCRCVYAYVTDRYFNSSTHFSIEYQTQNWISTNEINQSQSAHSSTHWKSKISSLIIRNNSFDRKSMRAHWSKLFFSNNYCSPTKCSWSITTDIETLRKTLSLSFSTQIELFFSFYAHNCLHLNWKWMVFFWMNIPNFRDGAEWWWKVVMSIQFH